MRSVMFLITPSLFLLTTCCVAADDLTLANVTTPEPNKQDEPIATSFSLERAAHFLDQVSLDWTKNRKCFTCHTNYAYLLARPSISADSVAHREVRKALEELVEKRWTENGPRWDAEVVMSAAILALNDAATTGKLHVTTRKALDRMWTVQQDDGGINWLKCGWPPMESDDHFGATMIAIAAGAASEEYRQTDAAVQGLARLRGYFAKNTPPTLHHAAMRLWADTYVGDLLPKSEREATVRELLRLQKEDGGWNLATLGDWKRADGKEQDVTSSDGYATGFVVYVLHRAGLAADHPQLQKGVAWLKANQRTSGRWYTRSLNKDGNHFLSHAGSAFAVLAITSCK